jgi:ATP-dependent Clp protease ATP-binding subunit ClpC
MAALETILTKCKAIEPEHLFLAMCKVADLPGETLKRIVSVPPELLERIEAEIPVIREVLRVANVDVTRARRQLRRLIGENPDLQGTFSKQRSERCRRVCHSAETRALVMGESEALPVHFVWALLSEGSPLIQKVVEESGGHWRKFCEACDVTPASEEGARADADLPEGGPGVLRTKVKGLDDTIVDPVPPHWDVRQEGRVEQVAANRSRTPFLDKFGRDITALAREGKLTPCIGRKDEMRTVAQILRRQKKNNPVLVGDAGVGKTCVVEGLALRIVHPEAPETIRDWRIVEISMGSLMAGAMYQGLLEERLQTILKEAQSDPNLILFLDEMHTLVGAGGGHGKGLDAAQILKPAMARGEIRLVGATTTAEYRKYIESDSALERRLEMVWVNEPSRDEAVDILDGLRRQLEEHHGVVITYEALTRAVEWSMRYIPDRHLPDKALDIVDQACAAQIMKTLSPAQDALGETFDMAGGTPQQITEDDIARIISERCQIPVGTIASGEAERLLGMEQVLQKRIIGQDDAIRQLADAVRTARAGLKKSNRPVGVFLLLGPTGTGKTELAKAVAEFLFGNEDALIRVDMSEYREKHNVSRLIGAPPGYIGHDDEGQLTGKVRTKPYSVILFDEIEKAHPDVFDILLQIFDDGRLTDSKGRRAMFTESIIIMTSNLGSADGLRGHKKPVGFHRSVPDNGVVESSASEHELHALLAETFRPEFLNRITRTIIFKSLSREVGARILERLVKQLNQRLEEKEITVELSPEAAGFLLKEGFSEVYGARELERVLDARIGTPLARAILDRQFGPGDTVKVQVVNGKIAFG